MSEDCPELSISATPLKAAISDSESGKLKILVELGAGIRPQGKRVPLSLALVLDRSGSMQGGRLETCKIAADRFIAMLGEEDEVGVICYDGVVDELVPLQSAGIARRAAALAFRGLDPRGSTNLYDGWFAGAQMIASRANPERLCRAVLLSDGHANEGITDTVSIARDVARLARSSIGTTTIGVGEAFNEVLMTAIARAGGGSAMYGNEPRDLFEPFEAELGLLRNVLWRDIRVRIVSASRGWECENDYSPLDGGESGWRLPDIAAGSQAWLALSIPMRRARDFATRQPRASLLKLEIRARGPDGKVQTFSHRMPLLEVVDRQTWAAMPADETVARRFLETEAARLQESGFDAMARGDWGAVERCLAQLDAIAAEHGWLRASLAELRRLFEQRDERLLSKELRYSSRSMRTRLTSKAEQDFLGDADESSLPAYLRRKSMQGRGASGR